LEKMQEKQRDHIKRSNDLGRGDVGVMLEEKQYWFMLKFYTYDNLTKEMDYPIEKAFEKIFNNTEDLLIMFPS
jgi:hypothetical protein